MLLLLSRKWACPVVKLPFRLASPRLLAAPRARTAAMPTHAESYLEKHGLEAVIQQHLVAVLKERPEDPIEALANRLIAHAPKKEHNPLGDEELRKVEKPMVSAERAANAAVSFGLGASRLVGVITRTFGVGGERLPAPSTSTDRLKTARSDLCERERTRGRQRQ